jgi:hypothetical protein
MKIGLLTLTPSHNYGGILQAVALYSYLESLGHEVVLIDSRGHPPIWKKIIFKVLEITPFQNIKNKRESKIKAFQLAPFLKEHLPNVSKGIYHSTHLKQLVEKNKFDAVVVGSDQVWRYQYIKEGDYSVYFLNFKVDFPIKKIAYAASFGKDSWEAPAEIEKIKTLMKEFNAVSVREKSGIDLCSDLFDFKDGIHVLDPTMLVGDEFYEKFIVGGVSAVATTPIVTYILDENDSKTKVVNAVAKSKSTADKSLQIINLGKKHNGNFYSVEDWLSNIKNADFVITDSFHGMLFSILFKKQFLVIGNPERGLARFTSFLSIVGLESRLLLPENSFDLEGIVNSVIDYENIALEVEKLRAISKQFLLGALG